VIAPRQIAAALADHDGKVTAVVPRYAMSGGTLIALAADEIVLDSHATLGPVDPQLGQHAAASILAAVEVPQRHNDSTLILADQARKAIAQVESFTAGCSSGTCRPSVRPTSRGCLVAMPKVVCARAEQAGRLAGRPEDAPPPRFRRLRGVDL
jgi:membrane-bound ClpP family serine protease